MKKQQNVVNQQSKVYQRAQKMVEQDKLDINQEEYCKSLKNFLSNYLSFSSLRLDLIENKSRQVVICVTVDDVKKKFQLLS